MKFNAHITVSGLAKAAIEFVAKIKHSLGSLRQATVIGSRDF